MVPVIFLDVKLGILIVTRRHISNADGVVLNISGTYPGVYGNRGGKVRIGGSCVILTEIANGPNKQYIVGTWIIDCSRNDGPGSKS